jgi:hypothetical protein
LHRILDHRGVYTTRDDRIDHPLLAPVFHHFGTPHEFLASNLQINWRWQQEGSVHRSSRGQLSSFFPHEILLLMMISPPATISRSNLVSDLFSPLLGATLPNSLIIFAW